MKNEIPVCPVCQGTCSWLDVVDFNKACLQALPLSGMSIYYALCGTCGFCFAPAIMGWSLEQFAQRIYNDQYAALDPEYLETRPGKNAQGLQSMFGAWPSTARHLDYGGGHGRLAEILRGAGWNSLSHDPFLSPDVTPGQLGQFDLVTAFEVFEHVPDVRQLMSDLSALASPDGLVLFSTLLSDGHLHPGKRMDWWYAAPRNGHISLFSKQSLAVLAQEAGFHFASFSNGLHVFFRQMPAWAAHTLGPARGVNQPNGAPAG